MIGQSSEDRRQDSSIGIGRSLPGKQQYPDGLSLKVRVQQEVRILYEV